MTKKARTEFEGPEERAMAAAQEIRLKYQLSPESDQRLAAIILKHMGEDAESMRERAAQKAESMIGATRHEIAAEIRALKSGGSQ